MHQLFVDHPDLDPQGGGGGGHRLPAVEDEKKDGASRDEGEGEQDQDPESVLQNKERIRIK